MLKTLRSWGLKDIWAWYEQRFVSVDNQWQNLRQKVRKINTVRQDQKLWYLLLRKFWLLLAKICFWRKSTTIACIPPSPNSFDSLWGNLYTKFIILDIKFRFIFGELKLHKTTVNYQKILSLWLIVFWWNIYQKNKQINKMIN